MGRWEAAANCTGSGYTPGPACPREQTETVSWGMYDQTENRSSGALTGTRLRPGALGARAGRLAAGGVRNTKDRDMPVLEVRAGTPGVGHTSRDAAGFSSTNRNRVKVARTSVENGPQSLRSVTEAEIRPLLL